MGATGVQQAVARPAPKAAEGPARRGLVPSIGVKPERAPASERRAGTGLPSLVRQVLASPGEPLDPASRTFGEARFCHDFGAVRVHRDRAAADAAAGLEAQAFTVGRHVVFGEGRYRPETVGGRRLIAHELAHTIQQAGASEALAQRAALDGAPLEAANRAEVAAEHAADLAADQAAEAALAGHTVAALSRAGGSAAPLLQRQRVTNVENVDADTKIATLQGGERIRVHRVRWAAEETSLQGWTHLAPGIDRQRVWLELSFCANQTHGNFRLGANIPERVLQTILRDATSGGNLDAALRQIDITPFASFDILQNGAFRLEANGQVTIDRQGNATGWGAGATLHTGEWDFGVTGGPGNVQGRQEGWQVQGSATWTPGRRTPSHECRRETPHVVERTRFECQRLTPRPDVVTTEMRPATERRNRFVYFQYARDSLAPRSTASRAQILGDLRDGFRVASIKGFTSPEGPTPRGRGGFVGNEELARMRARAAARVVEESCRQAGIAQGESCYLGGSPVTPQGEGELYQLVALDSAGAAHEVEGDPQAEHAAQEFLEAPEEAQHRTPELEAQLRAPGTSARQDADLVYPLLRRAAVVLEKTVQRPTEVRTPQSPVWSDMTCPDDLADSLFPLRPGERGRTR